MALSSAINKRNFIYSLEKGLSILNLFSQLGPQLTLSELAKDANMGLGTATRYVQTLIELGYLIRDPSTKKYRLSPKILSLGFGLLKDMDLRARLTPYLSEINRELGVGAQCAILDETEIVYVERFRTRSLVALDLTVGSRLPAYCSALGRAILAFMDSKSVHRIVAKMDMAPLTPSQRFVHSPSGGSQGRYFSRRLWFFRMCLLLFWVAEARSSLGPLTEYPLTFVRC